MVQNFGNTITNWTTEAEIFNALPDLTAIEDFSGINPIWSDDGNENGTRLDDSTTSNQVLPQNQGVFKNYAYWLGDPDVGYGDDWNEPMSVGQSESAKQILTIPTYPGTTTQRETIL